MNMNKYSIFDDLKRIDQLLVGFDNQFDRLSKLHDATKNFPIYPPYNIKKIGDNKYIIEIAVAGFSKSDIDIKLEDSTLTVSGSSKNNNEENYVFKGIGMRDFNRKFALNEQVQVIGADISNGMLRIALEQIIPEHMKPRHIQISDELEIISNFVNLKTQEKLLVEHNT